MTNKNNKAHKKVNGAPTVPNYNLNNSEAKSNTSEATAAAFNVTS